MKNIFTVIIRTILQSYLSLSLMMFNSLLIIICRYWGLVPRRLRLILVLSTVKSPGIIVAGVASCSSLARTHLTSDWIRNSDTTEIFSGPQTAISEAPEKFAFGPPIDGPGGLYPGQGNFHKIALHQWSWKGCLIKYRFKHFGRIIISSRHIFLPATINSKAQLQAFFIADFFLLIV